MQEVDVIVLGGGIAGCMAAKKAAEQGLRAAIVERRGFLGWELSATGITYLQNGPFGDELPLSAGSIKKRLLVEQLALGNVPLLFSQAAAIGIDEKSATGVLLGNGYGTQYLAARAIIDTEGLADALLRSVPAQTHQADAIFHIEVDRIGRYYEEAYAVTPTLGLCDDKIRIHPLMRDHAVTISFSCPVEITPGPNGKVKVDLLMREKAFALMRWLRQHVDAFSEARLITLASESRYIGPPQTAPHFPDRLYSLGQTIALQPGTTDIEELERAVSAAITPFLNRLENGYRSPTAFRSGASTIPVSACTFSPFDDRNMKVPLQAVCFDPAHIAARIKTDVLVAGAGTSGAMAVRALLESGTDFVLLDANSQIGGTNAVGGVSSYWHGYRGGVNPSIDEAVAALSVELCGEEKKTSKPGIAHYLQNLLISDYHRCYLGSILCGGILADGCVLGAFAASETGLIAFDAQVTLDMTGDGTVAMLLNLPYAFGDPDDGSAQSYSQFGLEPWSVQSYLDVRTAGDPDVIYQDKYSELLRGAYVGHYRNSDWDFSPMPTTRESRRVLGEYQLTMKDIVGQYPFDDTVCITNTPFDVHGLGSSPLCDMQIIVCEEPLMARIPYRCYVPKGINGLLVGGKAFSGTRDAVCVCRMNADLRNAGYMLGTAAGMAVRAACHVRDVDINALQHALTALDILPPWTWDAPDSIDFTLFARNRINMARVLLEGMLPEDAYQALKTAHTDGRDIVLSWYGDADALSSAAQTLIDLALSGRIHRKEDEAHVCQLVTVLGRTADKRWLPALAEAAARAGATGPAQSEHNMYRRNRVDYWRVPNYMVLLCIAKACARMADEQLIAPLSALLADPNISGYVTAYPFGMPKPYFCAYLELHLASALARCGGREGYHTLAAYTADVRYQLSQMSHDILAEITGNAYGYDPVIWAEWIDRQDVFTAMPWTSNAMD